jgi:hypothetical protein
MEFDSGEHIFGWRSGGAAEDTMHFMTDAVYDNGAERFTVTQLDA